MPSQQPTNIFDRMFPSSIQRHVGKFTPQGKQNIYYLSELNIINSPFILRNYQNDRSGSISSNQQSSNSSRIILGDITEMFTQNHSQTTDFIQFFNQMSVSQRTLGSRITTTSSNQSAQLNSSGINGENKNNKKTKNNLLLEQNLKNYHSGPTNKNKQLKSLRA